jgi:hypothetical protein
VYPTASTQDFSRDRVLADVVRDAGLERHIVSAQDWDATTIGGYLGREVHSLARGERITFLTTDARQERGLARLTAPGVACAAAAIADRRGEAVALVVAGSVPGYRPLAVNDGAAVYRIEPGSADVSCDAARRRSPARAAIPPSV